MKSSKSSLTCDRFLCEDRELPFAIPNGKRNGFGSTYITAYLWKPLGHLIMLSR